MKKYTVVCVLFQVIIAITVINPNRLTAQEPAVSRTPEEQRELFGYCEKFELMNQFKISAETADRIGQVIYWITIQKLKIEANTNDTFAVPKEVDDEAVKKYKSLHLAGDQIKTLLEKHAQPYQPESCAIITLNYNHYYDTISPQRMLLLYKQQFRKMLLDKTGVNGRQADMLFEVEVWKQKEALAVATIPVTDFNRVRKTVALNTERERRFRVVGITDQQAEATIDFFNQHQLGTK